MIDSDGNEIPIKYVSKYDRLRDRQVRKIAARFVKARAMLEALVRDSIKDLDVLMNAKDKLGAKGNFSAQSFDALISVSIRQQYNIRLDERVAKARELMLDYANRELERAGDGAYLLSQMIEAAFKVDRLGFLPRSEVAKLLSYKVDDASWNAGADILRQAQTTERGKRYLTIEERRSLQDDFRPVRLDIADCWPAEESEVSND